MKTIRIKICEFDRDDKILKNHFIYKILEKYYNVELSGNPDYLFFNESSYEHLKYDCIKIFYTGENISPNFNLCDYAIGFDYMTFMDRYYRFPLYLALSSCEEDWALDLGTNIDITKMGTFSKEDLAKKTDFCSFVYSNYLADDNRKNIFTKLSDYKKINAAGSYLNNTDGKKIKNKLEYEMKHKFSIAFENSSRAGYTTEKLHGALAAKTIPIYWGNPEIALEFNEKRFINCHNFSNFNQVVERVKEIDNDDDLYLSIINEPVTTPSYNFMEVKHGFDNFLRNIFDQPIEKASRRTINLSRAAEIKKNELIVANYVKIRSVIKKILSMLYRPFKNITFLKKLKYAYFKNRLR